MAAKKLIGYKMTKPDGSCFSSEGNHVVYEVGKVVSEKGEKGEPCGVGLHLGKKKHIPLIYNARYPWRLFECSYARKDVLGQDEAKVRVSSLKVVKELAVDDIGLPNCKRVVRMLDRACKVRLMFLGEKERKQVERLVKKHVELMTLADKEHREIPFKGVQFYTIKEWGSIRGSIRDSIRDSIWDSIRGSIWGSIRDSIWDSIRDSIWDSIRGSIRDSIWGSIRDSIRGSIWGSDSKNPFLPCLEIAELGAAFYGIDNDGIAHIIAPSEDEVKP